jgi:cell fate regulator YaaT (PSP1 superfamily)
MGVTGFDLKKVQLSDMFRVTEPSLLVNYDHYLSEHTFNMVKNNSKLVSEELNRGLIKGVTIYDDKILIYSIMQFDSPNKKSENLEQKIKRYKLELYLADGNPSFCEVAFN